MRNPWPIPPEWIGRRIVVRHRLDPDPRPGAEHGDGPPRVQLTDTVGELVDAGDPLCLATRHGEVSIPQAAVVAAKRVPPRPSRPGPPHTSLSIADLERVATLHWRPAEQQRLGDWVLRAHHGVTSRANSALALGMPADLAATLDTVRAWYAARDLQPLLMLPVPGDAEVGLSGPPGTMPADASAAASHRRGHSPDGGQQLALRAAVEEAGWVSGGGVSAYTLTAATAAQVDVTGRDSASSSAGLPGALVELASAPDSLWQNLYRAGSLPSAVHELLASADEQVFVSVRLDQDTVAIGRGSHSGGWVGVTAVEVAPSRRRRGLARLVLAEIARWGARRRARSMFLQTAAGNFAAHHLYLSAGFAVHHRYDYLTPS